MENKLENLFISPGLGLPARAPTSPPTTSYFCPRGGNTRPVPTVFFSTCSRKDLMCFPRFRGFEVVLPSPVVSRNQEVKRPWGIWGFNGAKGGSGKDFLCRGGETGQKLRFWPHAEDSRREVTDAWNPPHPRNCTQPGQRSYWWSSLLGSILGAPSLCCRTSAFFTTGGKGLPFLCPEKRILLVLKTSDTV